MHQPEEECGALEDVMEQEEEEEVVEDETKHEVEQDVEEPPETMDMVSWLQDDQPVVGMWKKQDLLYEMKRKGNDPTDEVGWHAIETSQGSQPTFILVRDAGNGEADGVYKPASRRWLDHDVYEKRWGILVGQ
ncbi:hypothetical protein AK812_SmicGene6289 [Symbiodinium microadriaticum]|uniref:Uncharacterized protein n=1 Tax=Symbiodinium microadriaticum TaxID=2951 RepID=A0A1Q9ERL1_SYMMI|nr:hypothetical protein AK812_SmicGene6289 [Symbiodinium microadriaticum]